MSSPATTSSGKWLPSWNSRARRLANRVLFPSRLGRTVTQHVRQGASVTEVPPARWVAAGSAEEEAPDQVCSLLAAACGPVGRLPGLSEQGLGQRGRTGCACADDHWLRANGWAAILSVGQGGATALPATQEPVRAKAVSKLARTAGRHAARPALAVDAHAAGWNDGARGAAGNGWRNRIGRRQTHAAAAAVRSKGAILIGLASSRRGIRASRVLRRTGARGAGPLPIRAHARVAAVVAGRARRTAGHRRANCPSVGAGRARAPSRSAAARSAAGPARSRSAAARSAADSADSAATRCPGSAATRLTGSSAASRPVGALRLGKGSRRCSPRTRGLRTSRGQGSSAWVGPPGTTQQLTCRPHA